MIIGSAMYTGAVKDLDEAIDPVNATGFKLTSGIERLDDRAQAFGAEKDYFHLRGQDNLHRDLPLGAVGVRPHPDDSLFDTLARIAAVCITGNTAVVSIPPDLQKCGY